MAAQIFIGIYKRTCKTFNAVKVQMAYKNTYTGDIEDTDDIEDLWNHNLHKLLPTVVIF